MAPTSRAAQQALAQAARPRPTASVPDSIVARAPITLQPIEVLVAPAAYALSPLRAVCWSGGLFVYASPSVGSAWPVGVTISAAAQGYDVQVQVSGVISDPSWSWTTGESVLLGPDGMLISAQNSSDPVSILIGQALSPQRLLIRIAPPVTRA
jgi:hypothetical protein